MWLNSFTQKEKQLINTRPHTFFKVKKGNNNGKLVFSG